jgi:hypothetical protein
MAEMKTEWFWCPRCKRAFHSEVPDDYRPGVVIEEIGQLSVEENGGEWWSCPSEGCGGATVKCMHWSKLRENHPELPEVPESGELYLI